MDIVELLKRGAQTVNKRQTMRESVVAAILYHERRTAEYKEALDLIDNMGECNVERLVAIMNDNTTTPQEPEGGSSCH